MQKPKRRCRALRYLILTNAARQREPIGCALVSIFDFIWKRPSDHKDAKPEGTFRETIALQGIVAIQVAGLLAYIQKDPIFDPRAAMIYLGIFAIPLCGLIAIIWSRQNKDGRRDFVYSHPVRRYSLVALAISLAIVPSTTYYYRIGKLPGQGLVTLMDLHPIRFKNGEGGTEVEFETRTISATAKYPWRVQAVVLDNTSKYWEIENVYCYLDKAHLKPTGRLTWDSAAHNAGNSWIGRLNIAESGIYWMTVVLKRRQIVVGADAHVGPSKDEVFLRLIPDDPDNHAH